ncbi:hypothetical protein SteCoe_38330 [Stentor coeruleus]|uniref:Uncharacterized protein n=1 Tax=Stentor coeruleus TaxID=5963 RepID=A0A1R2ALL9_9CILI|nr:hypothetical protein SteCoe_38330 [Stentor coeruleus]
MSFPCKNSDSRMLEEQERKRKEEEMMRKIQEEVEEREREKEERMREERMREGEEKKRFSDNRGIHSMSLEQKKAYVSGLNFNSYIPSQYHQDIKEILFTNDGKYVFVCKT